MLLELQDKMEKGAQLSADDIKLWWEFHKLPEKYAYNVEYLERYVSVNRIIDDLGWPSVEALIDHLETMHNEVAAHNDSVYGERYEDPDFAGKSFDHLSSQLSSINDKITRNPDETDFELDAWADIAPRKTYVGNLNFGKRVKFRKWFTGVRPYTPGVDPADDVMYMAIPRYAFFRDCYDYDNDIPETFEYWIVGDKLYTIDRISILSEIRNKLEELEVKRDKLNLNSGMHEDDDWDYFDDDDDYSSGGDSGDNDQYSQAELDNHANQCNPNNDAYWLSRS